MDAPRAWVCIGVRQGDCDRLGVEVLTILALGSPVPVLVAMPGKEAAMEERRDER